MAYAWSTKAPTSATIAGHLAAVKLFHHYEREFELFLRHLWIVDALQGVDHAHVEAGTKSRIRRLVAWIISLPGEYCVITGDPGGVCRGCH